MIKKIVAVFLMICLLSINVSALTPEEILGKEKLAEYYDSISEARNGLNKYTPPVLEEDKIYYFINAEDGSLVELNTAIEDYTFIWGTSISSEKLPKKTLVRSEIDLTTISTFAMSDEMWDSIKKTDSTITQFNLTKEQYLHKSFCAQIERLTGKSVSYFLIKYGEIINIESWQPISWE